MIFQIMTISLLVSDIGNNGRVLYLEPIDGLLQGLGLIDQLKVLIKQLVMLTFERVKFFVIFHKLRVDIIGNLTDSLFIIHCIYVFEESVHFSLGYNLDFIGC